MTRSNLHAVALTATLGVTAGAFAGAGIEPLTTQFLVGGLDHAVFVTHAPGDYKRLYIVLKQGFIRVYNLKTNTLSPGNFLNIDGIVGGGTTTNNEQGLLGLAFHPDWQSNSTFFVNYTDNSGNTAVSKYTASSPDLANPAGDVIMAISQPFSNHNGGWLGFSPNDNYLYISTGDGGSAGDPSNNAQNLNSLLGKMLRVDVDGDDFPGSTTQDYAIPPSNPFVGTPGAREEIWAYGLRNPWRCSFDRANGDLFMGDVGQGLYEEISYQRGSDAGGDNYGWRCREGAHNYNFSGTCGSLSLTEPIYEYTHGSGSSITGGYVYRGCAIPSLDGTYFLSDYNSALIHSFTLFLGSPTNFNVRTGELSNPSGINQISSYGEDARGEMYIVDQGSGTNGQIFRITAVTPTIAPEDINCDGQVGFADILLIIAAWGPCDGCLEDLSGNGLVDFADILLAIGAWG